MARPGLGIIGALVAVQGASAVPPVFTDEAPQRGISYYSEFGGTSGNGLAFVDLDGDRDADVVLTGAPNGLVGLYENDGTGNFIDRAIGSGLPTILPTEASCVIAADYDADGDLDLYFVNWNVSNRLMRNEGNFHFTDVTGFANLGDDGRGVGSTWLDYDGDGWLDLYVGNGTLEEGLPPNRLYHNNGLGSFFEVAGVLGVDDGDATWQVVALDYDRDGDSDLYVSNDKGHLNCEVTHNHLFENDGGTFTDVTEYAGAEGCADSMGVAIGDFDGNGFLDLYCTNINAGNPLLMNQGDGTFIDQMEESGCGSYAVGWGAHFFDSNNDGLVDLYVCNMDAPNRLYLNDGVFPYPDVAVAAGLASTGISYCCASADIDDDGDLDLLLSEDNGPIRLYINQTRTDDHWVKFDVRGQGYNLDAVGAGIEVRLDGQILIREVQAGGMYKSQSELIVHVGLGEADVVDETHVTWIGGTTRVLLGYPADATWTIWPPERLCDFDGDAQVTLSDFLAFQDCYQASLVDCEIVDCDGDADIDLDDLDIFIGRYTGTIVDCDGNGVIDLIDIVVGTLSDYNRNAEADICEEGFADLNGDGMVNVPDLLAMIIVFGQSDAEADLNVDGIVNVVDLLILFEFWG